MTESHTDIKSAVIGNALLSSAMLCVLTFLPSLYAEGDVAILYRVVCGATALINTGHLIVLHNAKHDYTWQTKYHRVFFLVRIPVVGSGFTGIFILQDPAWAKIVQGALWLMTLPLFASGSLANNHVKESASNAASPAAVPEPYQP